MELDGIVEPEATIVYVDGELSRKANNLCTYTKTEVDTELRLRPNQLTTQTKTEVDGRVAPTATATYVDGHKAPTANTLTTYT
ncbi:MAG: hypothetical protein ACKPKO_05990, partial [Candidatus Fonsibacter sp.]